MPRGPVHPDFEELQNAEHESFPHRSDGNGDRLQMPGVSRNLQGQSGRHRIHDRQRRRPTTRKNCPAEVATMTIGRRQGIGRSSRRRRRHPPARGRLTINPARSGTFAATLHASNPEHPHPVTTISTCRKGGTVAIAGIKTTRRGQFRHSASDDRRHAPPALARCGRASREAGQRSPRGEVMAEEQDSQRTRLGCGGGREGRTLADGVQSSARSSPSGTGRPSAAAPAGQRTSSGSCRSATPHGIGVGPPVRTPSMSLELRPMPLVLAAPSSAADESAAILGAAPAGGSRRGVRSVPRRRLPRAPSASRRSRCSTSDGRRNRPRRRPRDRGRRFLRTPPESHRPSAAGLPRGMRRSRGSGTPRR